MRTGQPTAGAEAAAGGSDGGMPRPLDNLRNQLIQLELFLSSGTVCLSLYSLVAGVFGMNIPYTWNDNHGYVFKWVVLVSGLFCAFMFVSIVAYARHKGLVGS
ncbi:hypothetical protein PR202_gb11006 [Eleusine coracana subsp. coracana]|uniref:Uncharacterized protein n=1 Tax=Eleusine coracana subsp. coracana TaxID=191504 RepID=A0AAV5ELY0_ELECO|nr:hypothetical protein PR202_gb11006 [Eleusine coracana subsp. coracana]